MRIFVPTRSAEDWRRLLADPDRHWETRYSAKTLAYCWEDADGFPACVREAFAKSNLPTFQDLSLLLAIPEVKVDLPGGRAASQTDLFALGRRPDGLVAIAVEGKVDEPFGEQLVSEWLADGSPGKVIRLRFLCEKLGLQEKDVADCRYQLLHRTVSALLLAEQYHASSALMLVHSFSPEKRWFDDYAAFAARFGIQAQPGSIHEAGRRAGKQLFLGWSCGDQKYRSC